MDVPAASGGTRGGAGSPDPASEEKLTHAEPAGNTPLYAIHGNTPLVVATLTGEGRWGLPGVNNTNS
jgi:hypothetical protein